MVTKAGEIIGFSHFLRGTKQSGPTEIPEIVSSDETY